MNKILKRDEYINEVYTPMIEQKEYDELVTLNEGRLKTLFGMIKNLFKKDWETVKGNESIKAAYKEIDDSLTGFSTMKLSKKEECNQVRQVLVDFATDWYNLKMEAAKKEERSPKLAKSMNFKDTTLKENLDVAQNKIKELTKDDPQMEKWANLLLDNMKIVINRSIINGLDDEEKAKAEEIVKKQKEEAAKKTAEENKKMEEWQSTQLKEIEKERSKLISDVEATPMSNDILGGKAIKNIYDEFKNINEDDKAEDMIETFRNKTPLLGLKHIFVNTYDKEKGNVKHINDYINTSYKFMKAFYDQLNTDMDLFKEVPGGSVQAMCIGINAVIKNAMFGDKDYSDALPLMAKCAVISDGIVSYNLPTFKGENPVKKKEVPDGNYFTNAIGKIIKYAKANEKDLDLPNDFNTNAKNLFDKIVSEAEKLKKESIQKRNDTLNKIKANEYNKKES